MIRSNQAGQAKNRPPRREEGENGNLQRFPLGCLVAMFFGPRPHGSIFPRLLGRYNGFTFLCENIDLQSIS
ncbi:hypothetical protein [Profundibacter sp.]|uniref:hypothetical protein n=1 Tax=Profundibacter sp. TaxID=3101071 RepID=UPI003D0F8862